MRIFVSWSGQQSRAVAELLRWWIPNVVQDADVYVSSQDIAKGERWLGNVGTNLSDHDFGLVVVTPENLNAPWIQFEAGALSKSVKSRVIPLLCGFNAIEAVNNPLTQFQYAVVSEEDLYRVLEEINRSSKKPLDEQRLKSSYYKWFPDFHEQFSNIALTHPKSSAKAKDTDRLDVIESALGQIMKELRNIAQQKGNMNLVGVYKSLPEADDSLRFVPATKMKYRSSNGLFNKVSNVIRESDSKLNKEEK